MRKEKFGRRLSQLLLDHDLTGRQLARMINVDDDVVSRWKTGKNLPRPNMMQRIADGLGITIDELERQPESNERFAVTRLLRLGYRTVAYEDLPPDWQGQYVPVLGQIGAGPGIDTVEAESYRPGDASKFVAYEPATPTMVAVEVIGDSMLPKFEQGDLVIAELADPVNSGIAVVIYLDKAGDRIARLKFLRRSGLCVRLESLNKSIDPITIATDRIQQTGRVVKRLPFLEER